MTEGQRPLELILARNLITGLSTPAFLVDEDAVVVFYNEAAGACSGAASRSPAGCRPEVWSTAFGPMSSSGDPLTVEQLPLTQALRRGRPAHHRFRIQSLDDTRARDRGERDPDRDHRGHPRSDGDLLADRSRGED